MLLLSSLALYRQIRDPSTFAFQALKLHPWHNTKLLLICLVVSYLFVCLVKVLCLQASGENHPFDLGYCNSAPTIGFLSVCLVPLILLIRRTILSELPTSKLYEPPNPFNLPNNLLKASALQATSIFTSILQTRFFYFPPMQ